ncbi:MAG: hypothetical protein A3G52_03320 [Candidatus Taylorbacteria bacterium RIFCSPLOWO2_12_FULL_43_20]|uniref:8-oxo-dGTP diphosphatase n=1 Tax=Candidatus Taylorbacteria bacterium RIFCSPLOWO2_12_FULL_43_20 TaxID=1802332 RepID=A0A1G2P377_9BACT|nr:MAG: hypothetical protein A2825_00095 [Candidatus Taylorbacteria bacterium RIFCSPHIGHO2_01_FULL_43_120]OHA23340.1 MAG: hypothetical protein A3B98_00910 [Candidatus Taylorbacteria bacterium RIFCSPHIGHO2_02_FULL_43_55]OHA29570.1 MAG: hypothetical protein A3E92_00615 [Candidatus Taylorbacteria bacterium RIFCSPHIGHO2_12_FULL_42_34]OHA31226.1 MAG: hypothetical protein A3B09_03515 [Candidatus Taylorbacteria bacterium RIFCSPLOWO2_01_FULL_43_83]OHA38727.1 MAG: hypothetical protein A3H58_02745 [Candi
MKIKKRQAAGLIPFKKLMNGAQVFLQKRGGDAPRFPGYFGFFGGGMEEGESPENALVREIKEEMDIDIESYNFFGTYDYGDDVNHIFTLEVDDNFENKVNILEGEYGKFFGEKDLAGLKIVEIDKLVLLDFFKNQPINQKRE